MKAAWNTLWTIVLLLMALVGLLMSLCGGLFTLTNWGKPQREFQVLDLSVPSLLIGLVVLGAAVGLRRVQQRRKRKD